MAVIRPTYDEDGYTRVPNAWLRDPSLDPAPKAYLAYLLSHAAGYRCSTSQASRDMGVNRGTVTAWNAKLVERGYFLAVEQPRSGGGRFGENDYTITACTRMPPPLPEPLTLPLSDNPADPTLEPARSTVSGNPCTVEPTRSDRARSTRHIEEQGEKNTGRRTPDSTLVELPLDGADLFTEFWQAYPKKVGKDAARRAWKKAARRADPAKIVDVVRRYPFRTDRTYVKDPATWLNSGCWEDDLDAVAAANHPRDSAGNGYRSGPNRSYGPLMDIPTDADAYRGGF